MRLASLFAARTKMALCITIVGFGQHRATHANGAEAGLLGCLLDSHIGAFVSYRRKKIIAVRQIRMVLFSSANAHKFFDFIVIWRDLLIANRPIFSMSIA